MLWIQSVSSAMQRTFLSFQGQFEATVAVPILLFTIFLVLFKMAVSISSNLLCIAHSNLFRQTTNLWGLLWNPLLFPLYKLKSYAPGPPSHHHALCLYAAFVITNFLYVSHYYLPAQISSCVSECFFFSLYGSVI